MNDERMISQTPTVHKLDEVSSWCLADCSKYVRESQWRRVNVVSHVGWSFLLPGSEKRECVLCHVGCLCPAAGRWRERMCSIMLAGFVLLLASGKMRREREMVTTAFYVAPGRWPGQNGISRSHWVKIYNDHNSQINLRAKQKYKVLSATASIDKKKKRQENRVSRKKGVRYKPQNLPTITTTNYKKNFHVSHKIRKRRL